MAEGGQIALPITAGADEQALFKAKLSDKPVLASCEANKVDAVAGSARRMICDKHEVV